MGDHGESFGEHGDQEHPASLYEPQIHVPLIVKWPHARGGAVVDAPVSGIDILATVLSAAGLPLPPRGAGRDLSAPPDPLRAIYAEDFYGNADVPKGPRASTAIVIGTRKLLLYEDGQREAFDLGTDPEERHDLYTESDTEWRNMAARLQAALDGWRRTGDRLRPHGAPDRTMIERLRALGYLR